MSAIDDIKTAMAAAKADLKVEEEKPKAENATDSTITDKAAIEAALADMVEEPQDELSKIHARICEILAEHKNEITSIPRGHEYWKLMNRYNGLRNP